jgi:hypothetical protein
MYGIFMPQRKRNKKHLYCLLAMLAAFAIYLFVFESGAAIRKIWFGQPLKILILADGADLNDSLDVFIVYLADGSKPIKILSINSDINSPAKRQSLKKIFKNAAKKDAGLAATEINRALIDIFGPSIKSDFYIAADNAGFSNLKFGGKFSRLVLRDDFKNYDDKILSQMQIFEILLNRFERVPLIGIAAAWAGRKNIDSNLSRAVLLNLAAYLALSKRQIFFSDLGFRNSPSNMEHFKRDAAFFLETIFFAPIDENRGRLDGFIEIKNASQIPQAARNLTWALRENNFDVLDYSNSQILSDKTIIRDYKGNFNQALAIAAILKKAKIIVSYDSRYYYDTTVFIGADYKLKENKWKK